MRRCRVGTTSSSICLIGSGPIVIGQACEFDYAGCQALKVLREDGFRTIVVNSNPATIMTDPGFADRTYLEPLDLEGVADVLGRERPDALLPTMGGQTALNLARELAEAGVLDDARRRADRRAARRDPPRRGPRALPRRGASRSACGCPSRASSPSLDELDGVALPAVVRPAFTLGGHGGGFASTRGRAAARRSSAASRESPDRPGARRGVGARLGRVRARGRCATARDNVVIVCSIENLDPMGVHTGDSVTVAPQMTLSDEAYQELRDAAVAIIRAVGVESRRLEHPVRARPRDAASCA